MAQVETLPPSLPPQLSPRAIARARRRQAAGRAWREYRRSLEGMIGLGILVVFVAVAVFDGTWNDKEDPDLPRTVPGQLADAANQRAILRAIGEMGRAFGDPGRVVGMHFFNPPTKMRLVEVISAAGTTPATTQRAAEMVAALGKTAVHCADSPNFIVNRVCRPLYYEAQLLVTQGVEPAVVDAAASGGLGHPIFILLAWIIIYQGQEHRRARRFGRELVFLDSESIPPGQDFIPMLVTGPAGRRSPASASTAVRRRAGARPPRWRATRPP